MVNGQLLGATLYVPANHPDLLPIANQEKLAQLRSVIFCTEDAVAERDLPAALDRLAATLRHMNAEGALQRFVRVRNLAVMKRVLAMRGAGKLAGFVLPKVTRHNLAAYCALVRDTDHMLMPTLETVEVFQEAEMHQLRAALEESAVRSRILALRIGGNDLFALLGMRRPRGVSIYRTPLGPVIARLATTFMPYGFVLTAPVFEYLDNPALLDQEVAEDLAHGMVGKTAIHPDQVALIERHYQVQPNDIEVATRIMDVDSPAVFRMDQSMCEVATHMPWARSVIERARRFGVVQPGSGAAAAA
ncbi:MAG: HpcH/HpaI aldolase/citrate lyase family protein [Telluria sp.]|nr:HpcH/HpaI aldolase/citrate lyase family protein [Telluria sp.]